MFFLWTTESIKEALSEQYRQYFREHFNREPTNAELFLFYQLCKPQTGR